jgi:hypothetical protein
MEKYLPGKSLSNGDDIAEVVRMKRWVLAAIALLVLSPVVVRADYLILILNVGEQPKTSPPSGNGMMGGPPGMNFRGGPPGAGALGAMGVRGVPGGNNIGMPPGAGMFGMQGGPFGGLGMQGVQGGTVETKPSYVLVPVCLEVDANASALRQFDQAGMGTLKHRWGQATLVRENGPIALATAFYRLSDGKAFLRVEERYKAEHARLMRDKPSTDKVLELADWALSHGLLNKFEELMDKLAVDDKSNAAVADYLKVKAELAKPVAKMPSAEWFAAKKNSYKSDMRAPHWVVLHNLPEGDSAEVASRVDRLEKQLRSYYFWFARHGLVLPMPPERLVAIVAGSEDEVKFFKKGFYSDAPIVADGFYTPRENVTVLSVRPLSKEYTLLDTFANTNGYWQETGMARPNVLRGTKLPRPTSPDQVAKHVHAAAAALALKALEDNSEQASVSNDASRQLLFASGLLPRNVVVPEWALYGMSSLFGTVPGSPWPTLGAPNVHLLEVKDLRRNHKLEASGALLIRHIVTDTYFRQAQTHKDPALLKKAEATAWSLCFFLAQKKLANLQAYFKELSRLPRDIDLDEEVLMGCFARAFDAWDPVKKAVNTRRLDALATECFNHLNATPLEGEELFLVMKQAIANVEKKLSGSKGSGNGPTGSSGLPGVPPGMK